MAARSRVQLQVGSAQWVTSEHQQTAQFIEQEVEEFSFSVRNEMEWLNEHMAEVFSRNQFDVVNIFKTPGKLRGKTPRTARKRNPSESRQPLTDIFTSANEVKASPALKSQFQKQISQFKVAEDIEIHTIEQHAPSRFSASAGKENTSSGYNMADEGITDSRPNISYNAIPSSNFELKISQQIVPRLQPDLPAREERQESPGSFVSAQEAISNKVSLQEEEPDKMNIDLAETNSQAPSEAVDLFEEQQLPVSHMPPESKTMPHDRSNSIQHEPSQTTQNTNEAHSSSSETSTPDRQIVRKKSSLNFATLPAREPLTSKKSVGPAPMSTTSRSNHSKSINSTVPPMGVSQEHPVADTTTSKSFESHGSDTEGGEDDLNIPGSQTKLHSLTSTQRLHERITMLGKMNPARPSKSIPSSALISQVPPPEPAASITDATALKENLSQVEDEWIEPLQNDKVPFKLSRQLIVDSATNGFSDAVTVESRNGQQAELGNPTTEAINVASTTSSFSPSIKPIDRVTTNVTYPKLATQEESTTPLGSPIRTKNADGPLNASKAKLYSVFQSAKGIFASSAGVSAQAKMETFSPKGAKGNANSGDTLRTVGYPTLKQPVAEIVRSIDQVGSATNTPVKPKRRSSERLKQAKDLEESGAALQGASTLVDNTKKNISGLDDVQVDSTNAPSVEILPASTSDVQASAEPSQAQTKSEAQTKPVQQQATSSQKTNEMKRPIRPPPKEHGPKARPAPVSIRVASQKIAHAAPSNATATFGTSIHEQQNAEAVGRPQTLTEKASNSSIRTTSSTQSYKGTNPVAAGRPKALEAAARKREQDEREAQRKAEQKRDIERRKAAKAEEERRAAEEQKAIEQQKALDARKQAERKAEAAKKAEAQRSHQASTKSRALEDDNPFRLDRSQGPQNHPRGDLGPMRPVSRIGNAADDRRAVPHINPAKPAKRHWNPDADEEWQQKSCAANGQSSTQPQAKRRRTSEDEFVETISRPKMAPPVRLSKVAKDISNKFAHGYMSNASSSHQASSMMKSTVISQHQAYQSQQYPKTPHMNDLAKYTNGKIPFAEQPNPPQSGYTQQSHHRTQQHTLKTPGTTSRHQKSSPQYPNGENIELPEIASDSEDSDDGEFVPPDWANSPALRELLAQQQLIDPQKVFGPIAPLVMEEVFKGSKERMAKFRSRTSSANWNGPDRLTESERRRDQEAREKLERDGGWTFNAGV